MTAVAAARTTPPPLAAYLRRATWGLGAKRRQELWNELEEHVLERADHLCAFGTPYEHALARAIAELGPPAKVSAGMTEVYLMPKLLISAGAAALAIGAAFFTLAAAGKTVSLPVLTERPITPACAKGTRPTGPAIKIVSEKGGVTCYTFNDSRVYAGTYIGLNDLKKAFVANGIQAKVAASGDLEVMYPNGTRRVLTYLFSRNGQGYTDAENLITSTAREPVTPELKLSGYNDPTIMFGSLSLRLGTKATPVNSVKFYADLVPTLLGVLTSPDLSKGWEINYAGNSRSVTGVVNLPKHVIQTSLNPGEVVVLATKRDRGTYSGDVAPVGPDGTVTLYSEQKHITFVTDPAQLSPYASGGRVNALLLRVTNIPLRDLKTGIFTPAQPTSDAR